MNKRQALKAATAMIEDLEGKIGELEHYNSLSKADITAYNKCIDGMIAGKSPCDWCEENANGECKKPEKGGKGCNEWMLMWDHGEKGDDNDGEAVSEAGDAGRIGTENIEGSTGTL